MLICRGGEGMEDQAFVYGRRSKWVDSGGKRLKGAEQNWEERSEGGRMDGVGIDGTDIGSQDATKNSFVVFEALT